MSTHLKPAPRPESLLGAWHAQVAATAKHSPWLVREMLHRKQKLLPKITAYYRQLRALPRRTRRLLQRRFAPSLVGAALLLALGQGHAIAANFTAGNATELNDAITMANSTVEADTITLTADITLTTVADSSDGDSGTVAVSSALTIEGNDHAIARDPGAPGFRVLFVNSTGALTVRETTLSGGKSSFAGAGLLSKGSVTLEGCTVSGNSTSFRGGGVYSITRGSGQATITNSTISGNTGGDGGGVHSRAVDSSRMTITNSTISGNTGSDGGGVYSITFGSSQATITNSTISGNSAFPKGGGVYSVTDGSSHMTLTNSTISGNSGGRYGGGVWTLTSDSSHSTLQRLLVAGNTAPTGAEVYWFNFGGTFTVNDYNLFGRSSLTTAQALSGFAPGATDLTATSDGSDPTALTSILDTTLQNNGGPTQTHALIAGSPAIDASPVDADCPATDQRGALRPQGAACDIGAFEFAPEICGNCIDDDDDGKIDLADDDCQPTDSLAVAKGKLTLKPDPNKDQILLNANFPSVGVTIDPPTEGVAVSFFDADGGIECLAIPPNSAGWKVNKKGTMWSFKDAKDDSLGDPEAEEKVIIKRNDKKGRYEITIAIKEAELIDPDAGLISSGIVIGDELRVNQQVWESAAKGKKLVTP